jgi:hypothetical protein
VPLKVHKFVHVEMIRDGDSFAVTFERGETGISPRYDPSQPGEYVIQLSRPISDDPKNGVVKSDKLTITVTP